MEQKSFNFAWFFGTVVPFLLVGLLVHLWHGWQLEQLAQQQIARAEQALAEEDLLRAAQHWNRSLAFDPDRPGSWVKYAQTLDRLARTPGEKAHVMTVYRRALARQPASRELRERLGVLAMQLGRYSEAQGQLNALLTTAKKAEEKSQLLARLARCQEAQRQFPLAAQTWKDAIALAPGLVEAHVHRARLLRDHLNRESEADKVMLALVQTNPDDPRAHLERGRFLLNNNSLRTAAEELARARQLLRSEDTKPRGGGLEGGRRGGHPSTSGQGPKRMVANRHHDGSPRSGVVPRQPGAQRGKETRHHFDLLVEVLAISARVAWLRGRLEEATDWYRLAIERASGKPSWLYLELAQVQQESDQLSQAESTLREGLKTEPEQPEFLFALANVLLEQHSNKELGARARVEIQKLHQGKQTLLADYLEARLAMKRQRWNQAMHALEDLPQNWTGTGAKPLPSPPKPTDKRPATLSGRLACRAQLDLARCYRRLGCADLRLLALARAVVHAPFFWKPRQQLAQYLLELGRDEEALSQTEALVRLPGARAGAWLLQTWALLRRNLKLPPHTRNWPEVEKTLQRAEALLAEDPGEDLALSVQASVLRGRIAMAQGKHKQARTLFEQLREDYPDQPGAWLGWAEWVARQGDFGRAARVLGEARSRATLECVVDLALAQARYQIQGGRYVSTQDLLQLEQGIERYARHDQNRLRIALAQMHLALGRIDQASRLAQECLVAAPAHRGAHLLLVEVALSQGKESEVLRRVKILRQLEGKEGTSWRYAQAALLLERASRDQVFFPESGANGTRTLAGSREDQAKLETLIEEIAQQRPEWVRGLLLRGRLQQAKGMPLQALNYRVQAIQFGARQPGVIDRCVRSLGHYGRHGEADRILRMILAQQPSTVGLKRLAAESSFFAHQHDRAAELAAEVVRQRGQHLDDLIWQGQLLRRMRRYLQAEDVLRRAVARSHRSSRSYLALITLLVEKGDRSKVRLLLSRMEENLYERDKPLALARAYEKLGDVNQAEQSLALAVHQRSRDYRVLQQAASFHLRLGQWAQAEPLLAGLLLPGMYVPQENVPAIRRELALVRAWLTPTTKQINQSLALVNQNKTRKRASLPDRRARAFILAQLPMNRRKSLQTLETLPGGPARSALDFYRISLLYEADKRPSRAFQALRRALALDDSNPTYLARGITFALSRGVLTEARHWLVKLKRVTPDDPRITQFQKQLEVKRKPRGVVK